MRLLMPLFWPVNALAYWVLFALAVLVVGLGLFVVMSKANGDDTYFL